MSLQPAPSAAASSIDAWVRERFEWMMASDPDSDAVSRVLAYGRWIAAAKHAMRFRRPWAKRRLGRQPVALVLEVDYPREMPDWKLLAVFQPSTCKVHDHPVPEY